MTSKRCQYRSSIPAGKEAPVAGIFLLRDDGAALLQHRDDKLGLRHAGMWVPPGGHCEPSEPFEACARREFLEETGYHCVELNWLTSFEDAYSGDWPPYQLTIYWASYDGLQPFQCMEGQALEFVQRLDAPAYPIPGYLVELWDLAIAAAARRPDRIK